MPTLAEIRAAAKAKAEQHPASPLPLVERVIKEEAKTVPETVVKQEEPIQPVKPLTFAEKMALKKKGLESTSATAPAADLVSSPKEATKSASIIDGVIGTAIEQEKQSVLQKVSSAIAPVYIAEIEAEDLERPEYENSSEEVKRDYRDIKGRINALSKLEDNDLAVAMSELKKALLQNPSACLLLYDEDLGILASSLRKLVHEDMIASVKPAKEKKEKIAKNSALQIPLTADMLATKFADL